MIDNTLRALEWAGEHFFVSGIIWFLLFVIFLWCFIYTGLERRSKYFNKYSWLIRLPMIGFYIILLAFFAVGVFYTEPALPQIKIYDYLIGALLIGTFVLSCIAVFRVFFKFGTDSEMTAFDGTWMTFKNRGVDGEEAVDDGYHFMILVLVIHQFFNLFSIGYISNNSSDKTSKLVNKYVREADRPVLPEGYRWKDFKGVPMALMIHESWEIETEEKDGIQVFSVEWEDANRYVTNPSFFTISMYPHEMVRSSRAYKNYCYGFTEDIVNEDKGNHRIIEQIQGHEKDGWFKYGLVRVNSVYQKDDSILLTMGLTDAVDQDVFVIRLNTRKVQLAEIYKRIEPTFRHLFLRRQLFDLTSE